MIFSKKLILVIISFLLIAFSAKADNHEQKKKLVDEVKSITEEIDNLDQADDEVPLNDPFAGNEGSSTTNSNMPTDEEEQGEMSLYNFKLVGLISGKDHSYITLVNSAGEVQVLTIGQELGKIKLIDWAQYEMYWRTKQQGRIVFF